MRRLLVPAALVLTAIAALAVLWPSWSDRATGTGRARPRVDLPERASAGDEAAGSAETTRQEGEGDTPPTRVHGTVTGPLGGLWGARVVAYGGGGDDVLAETYTNPEGAYSLAVEPDMAFDLAVEPMDLTGLLAARREGITISSGEERQEDVALAKGAAVCGRVVDEDGQGRKGIELVAVSEDASGSRAQSRTKTGPDGVFGLRGLAPGRYSLDVTDMAWMLPERVSVHAGAPDVILVVVPGLTVNLSVKDIETGEPVPAFTVRVRDGDRVLLDAAGRDGFFFTRTRHPGAPPRVEGHIATPRYALVDVAAPGFVPSDPIASSGEGNVVWLVPRRDPNTTVRVSFEDRSPYLGDLFVRFQAESGTRAAGKAQFERVRAGVFRGALPRGSWELSLIPSAIFGADHFPAGAEVVAFRETELALVLPAGGTLRFLPPAGVEHTSVWIRKAPESQEVSRGVAVQRPGPEQVFLVRREGAHVQGIPPGLYQVGYEKVTELAPNRFGGTTIWFREVRVDLGTFEEIALP